MLIYKGFKFKLKPTKEQKQLLLQHGGNTRFLWNIFLQQNIECYKEEQKFVFFHDLANSLLELKQQYDFLQLSYSQSLQSVAKQFDKALKDSYKTEKGFPTFKRKNLLTDSFTIPQHYKLKQGYVVIPKIGKIKWIKHRKLEGTSKYITITQNGNNWYCSVTCEYHIEDKAMKLNNIVGIDVGLKDFATLSNGETIENIRILKKHERKLAKAQRELSRKQKGSNNRHKQRMKVSNIHAKIRNIRQDFLHKTTNSIAKNYDGVVLENLNIKGMIKNSKLAKAISDVSWFEFRRQLKYKCEWNNKYFVVIDRFEPTTKVCSECGCIKENMTLADRIFECEECGLMMNRDLNAAINIRSKGLNDLNTVGHTEIYACGEEGSGFSSNTKMKPYFVEARKRTLQSAVSLTQQTAKEAPVL